MNSNTTISGQLQSGNGKSDFRAQPVKPRTPPETPSVVSTRLAKEADAIVANAADITNLCSLLVDALARFRTGLGVIWVADAETSSPRFVFKRLSGREPKEVELFHWIVQSAAETAKSKQEVVVSHDKFESTLIGLPIDSIAKPDVLVLLRPSINRDVIEQDALSGQLIRSAVERWTLRNSCQQETTKLGVACATLDLVGRIEATGCTSEAAQVLTDSVRTHLAATLVAVGLSRVGHLTSGIKALSGIADFDPKSVRSHRLRAALDEAIGANKICGWPSADDGPSHLSVKGTQNLAQRKLAEEVHCGCVISLPLHDQGGSVIGAMTICGSRTLAVPETERFLSGMERSVGGALRVIQRTQRTWLHRQVSRVARKSRLRLLAFVAVLTTLIALMWLPVPYRIGCRFQCEPVVRRSAVAPYDGLLKESLVRPGDVVEQGQVLATMDDRELRFELAGLIADMERAQTEQKIQFADEEIGASMMASLEADKIKSRRELIEHRLQNLEVRSTVDGLVLAGETDRKENYPVQVGQMLFEVAPIDDIRADSSSFRVC